MSLKEDYEFISSHTYNLEDIRAFKAKAFNSHDEFYLRKGELLLVRYYINNNEQQLALDLIKNNLENLEYRRDKENYRDFLDEAIYCSINLKDYRNANIYLNLKKDIIDSEDKDGLNRYYLEQAYLASLMNQMSKAVEDLKVILNNQPTPEMASLALGNITKLYLTEQKTEKAADYLNKAIAQAQTLNDEEALRYCDYLSIKLSLLENDMTSAKVGFEAFFKNDECEDEYLEFYNDYLNFLIDNKEVSRAARLLKKNKERFLHVKDNYLKRDFYLTQINLFINMAKESPVSQEAKSCLKDYRKITSVIDLEDKTLDDTVTIKDTTLPKSSLAVEFQSFKSALKEDTLYGAMSSLLLKFNDAFGPLESQVFFFDKSNTNNLITYNYKAKRCFNRDIPLSQLDGTVFEQILSQPKLIYGKLTAGNNLIDLFTRRLLVEEGFEQMITYPLFYKDDLIGAVSFLYKIGVDLDKTKRDSLDVLTTLLAYKYSSLVLEENYRDLSLYYNDLLDLDRPLFYYNIEQHQMKLSLPFKKLLGLTKNVIDRNDFLNMMIIDTEELNQAHYHIAHKEDYTLQYTYRTDTKVYFFSEEGYKLTNDTYRCLLKEVEPQPEQKTIGNKEDYHNYLKGHIDSRFTVLTFLFPDNVNLDDLYKLSRLYQIFKIKNYIRIIVDTNDKKIVENYIKSLANCYPYAKYNYVRYPKDVQDVKLIECAINYLWDEKEINRALDNATLLSLDQFYRSIDTCLDLNSVSLKCAPLKNSLSLTQGYLLHYILPGLYQEYGYINTHHHEFYDIVLLKLKDYQYDVPLYWIIPSLCIKHLVKSKKFMDLSLHDKLIFIIQDDHELNNLDLLSQAHYKIFISHDVLRKLSLNDLERLNIKGIYYEKEKNNADDFLIQTYNLEFIEGINNDNNSIDF